MDLDALFAPGPVQPPLPFIAVWRSSVKPMKSALQLQWERCETWLKAALAYDARKIPIDAVRADCFAGKYMLLPGERSAMLSEFVYLDGWRHLNIYLVGGDLPELLTVLLPRIEAWAAYRGCHSSIVMGRRGWVRALRPRGYNFLGRNQAGDWIVAKEIKADNFKDRTKPMTAVNYSIQPFYVALATDTLVTDGRDWWPGFLMPKAAFIPHLDALITCTSIQSVMVDAYNFALSAPVSDVEALSLRLPAICRQSFNETMALSRHSHPDTEDMSWVKDCALSLFGWSQRRRRLIGVRLALTDNFEPKLIADGVYAHPLMPACTPTRISQENVLELRDLTMRQQEQEIRKPVTDRNAIGGDILLWELEASPAGTVTSRVRKVHRFSTYEEDVRVIAAKAAS